MNRRLLSPLLLQLAVAIIAGLVYQVTGARTRVLLTGKKIRVFNAITAYNPYIKSQTEGDIGYEDTFEETDYDNIAELGKDPTFDAPLANATANVGETALLPCFIDYLGKYKVAWIEAQMMLPLTHDDRRVIDDSRFSIVRSEMRDWALQIQDTKLEDNGEYRCTVNTKPVSYKTVSLQVTVPVSIIDHKSSGNVTVIEGHDVTITCNAYGIPPPVVTWYRRSRSGRSDEDLAKCVVFAGSPSQSAVWSSVLSNAVLWHDIPLARGTSLTFKNTSRYCDDVYECLADNGVGSRPVSRRILISVKFSPQISLPNRRIGQSRGHQTVLECRITAYPLSTNYWEKGGRTISSSSKYKIEPFVESETTLILSLSILDIDLHDYGEYRCVAANDVGQDNQTMVLVESVIYAHSSSNHAGAHPRYSNVSPLNQPAIVVAPTRADVKRHQSLRSNISVPRETEKHINRAAIHEIPANGLVMLKNSYSTTTTRISRLATTLTSLLITSHWTMT